ncbi:hypothetical protein BX600DRAFT_455686 [Xylariales sp. PMI_506]|nr:hypothetical protein BX600DRAFT_455686 [Xylariales sp. PMI_506]
MSWFLAIPRGSYAPWVASDATFPHPWKGKKEASHLLEHRQFGRAWGSRHHHRPQCRYGEAA